MSSAFSETKRKMRHLEDGLAGLRAEERTSFEELFDIVWVYHDNALEGEVFAPAELRAALSDQIVTVSDAAGTSALRDIRAHKEAIAFVRREAQRRTAPPLLALVRQLHEQLTPDTDDRPGMYRRNGQVQRAYFHEIADAGRISYLLRKSLAWAGSDDALREHPIEVAARVHHDFVRIFPFEKHSGRVGRLLLNHMLLCEGFAPAVIHAQDRQRYYDAFKAPTPELLTTLIHESIENSIESVERRLRDLGGAAAARAEV